MTICSLVVFARPEKAPVVEGAIEALEGAEVCASTSQGKLVVLLDHPDRTYCSETIMGLNNIDGVISTSIVYEYFE
ncbi:MAG: chaperone NapD [Hyphomicrobiales bacterium]|nr:chaperone NapD [Hyphomicrobiales bacterium]